MSRQLLLRGGRILDPSTRTDVTGDLLNAGGKIDSLGGSIDVGARDDVDVLDCGGLVVAPGFIDVHCHLREPGREDVETIATGARAAAAGGFTRTPTIQPPSASPPARPRARARRASIPSARSRSVSAVKRSPNSARWWVPAQSR